MILQTAHLSMLRVPVGGGMVYYCGTNLGEGAAANASGFGDFLFAVCRDAGVKKNHDAMPAGVHSSSLGGGLLAVHNTTGQKLRVPADGRSIFFERESTDGMYAIPAFSADILKQ